VRGAVESLAGIPTAGRYGKNILYDPRKVLEFCEARAETDAT